MSTVSTPVKKLWGSLILPQGSKLYLEIYKQQWDIMDRFTFYKNMKAERLVRSIEQQYKTIETATSRQCFATCDQSQYKPLPLYIFFYTDLSI